ncbi:MAG: class I SAM-dependent methyltransferase [Actinomycetota bacterium]
MSEARYAYGDSSSAGDRLDLVARLFEPTSRRFLERAAPRAPRLALDLGCGPGNTTRLIADVLWSERTVGLDRSGPFLARARHGASPHVEFVEHDVFVTPFPLGPADVIFARLLLAHLPDRSGVVARWTTQLAPGGVLLLDEIEELRTDEPAFAEYLPIAIEVVGRSGGRLLAGPELGAMTEPPGTQRIWDEVVTLDATAAQVAPIFGLNLRVLAERGEIEPRPRLERDLAAIAERGGGSIEWRVRQIAFRQNI